MKIRKKALNLLVISSLIIILVMSVIGYFIFYKRVVRDTIKQSTDQLNSIVDLMDLQKYEEILDKKDADNSYIHKLNNAFLKIKIDNNYDALYTIFKNNNSYVYGAFAPDGHDDIVTLEEKVDDEDIDKELIKCFNDGCTYVTPVINSSTYGRIITIYVPIKNSSDDVFAVSAIDLSVENIYTKAWQSLSKIIIILLLLIVIIMYIMINFMNKSIMKPLNVIRSNLDLFSVGDYSNEIDKTFIHFHDEIGDMLIRTGEIRQNNILMIKMIKNSINDIKKSICRSQSNLEDLNNDIKDILSNSEDYICSRDQLGKKIDELYYTSEKLKNDISIINNRVNHLNTSIEHFKIEKETE